MTKKQTSGGLVKLVILIVIAILVLSYLGFDLKTSIESDQTQGNLKYVWGFAIDVWQNYLKGPILYLWNEIFIKLIWESFTGNMEKIKSGEPTDLELNASVGLNSK
ncbi:MAG: hypothetical protein AAB334_00150 [Patescibacteria group bacterium]